MSFYLTAEKGIRADITNGTAYDFQKAYEPKKIKGTVMQIKREENCTSTICSILYIPPSNY